MNLEMIRGDDKTFDIALEDADEALAVTFTAKRAHRDADVDALLRKDLDGGITVDETGIQVSIDAQDTADLVAPLVLVWDVEVVDAGALTTTVASGVLRIEADVTRSSSFVPGSGS